MGPQMTQPHISATDATLEEGFYSFLLKLYPERGFVLNKKVLLFLQIC